MKPAILFLTLALPLLVSAWNVQDFTLKDAEHWTDLAVKGFVNVIAEQAASDLAVAHEREPKNIAYDLIENFINGKLSLMPPIEVSKIGNETSMLLVENGTIALDGAHLDIVSGSVYNIESLKLTIPTLSVDADHYVLRDLNLTIVQVSGEGSLRITLKNFSFETKMDVKYGVGRALKFTVNKVYGIWLSLDQVQFDLENLGGEGDAISELLNSIVADVLPFLVESITTTINDPAVWEDDIFNLIFTIALNAVTCIAKGGTLQSCLGA